MNEYTYTNHNTGDVHVILAKSIGDADLLYEQYARIHPQKLMYVGCSIKFATVA